MKRNRRDWLTGLGTVAIFAVAYLLATPTGRAVQLAVRGVPVGTPQTWVRAVIRGSADERIETFCLINITYPRDPEVVRQLNEHARVEKEARTTATSRYFGPLFVVEFSYIGYEVSRLSATRVLPQVRLMGVVNLVGILLLGVGVALSSRLSRREAVGGQSTALPT